MTHVFKPGDRAYWIGVGWRELIENHEGDSSLYPLRSKDSLVTFTADGRRYARGGDVVLLPLNPYDRADPNNPQEFRSDWPFMLRGRPVRIGDWLILKGKKVKVLRMLLHDLPTGVPMICVDDDEGIFHHLTCIFSFPDELPNKKKVAKWAYPKLGMPGEVQIGFTDEMTQEEAQKKFGSFLFMVPGTEREVEL